MSKSSTLLLSLLCFLSITLHSAYASTETLNQQQERRVLSGKVTDAQNNPLPGVAVINKDLKLGVSTGSKGEYSIRIPQGGCDLEFSFIGMATKTIKVTSQTVLNVQLVDANHSIGEIMITTAYGGVQKKSDMVGSAFQINAEQIKNLPAARIDNILEGFIPGMNIQPNSDDAVARTRNQIRIRGNASLSAGNEPLWIVDGTPIYTGDNTNQTTGMSYSVSPLSFIDPADIESITVLKDAAETSIYGADGSNGIILITTKSGKSGKQSINLRLKYGVSAVDNSTKFKILNSGQYMMLAKEAWINAGNSMNAFPYQDSDINNYSTTDTDWYDVFYGVGQNFEANFSVSGGNDKMTNYFSMSYFTDKPSSRGNSQDRFSARLNSSYKISKRLTAEVALNTSYNINNLFPPGRDYYEFQPIIDPYYPDGSYRMKNKVYTTYALDPGDINPWTKRPVNEKTDVIWPEERNFFNSVAEREQNDNRQRSINTIGRISLSYEFIKGFKLSTDFNINLISSYEDMYKARTNLDGMSWKRASKAEDPERKMIHLPVGNSTRSQANNLNWTSVSKLGYSTKIGKHEISALAAFELKNNQYQTMRTMGSGFPNDQIKEVSFAERTSAYSSSSIDRRMSYFGTAKYSYDDRYLGTLTYRADGTSSFGSNSKWSKYMSGGLAWKISSEDFFNVTWVDLLKVRGSFGSVGNSRIGNLVSNGSYSTSINNGYEGTLGSSVSDIGNPGIGWETTYQLNLGVDIDLFERLQFAFEFYNNKTVDMISQLYVSRVVGQSRVYRNVGNMRNRGLEVSANYKIINQQDFSWRIDFNISHNKNKILNLEGDRMISFGNTAWIEGEDMNAHMVIRWAGVDPRDGAPLWYDKRGNITRTYSYDNRVPYKTSNPTIFGGFGTNFSWKNFSLYARMNYSVGGYVNSMFLRSGISDGYDILSQNQAVEALDRWRYPGQLAPNPANIHNNPMQTRAYSSRYMISKTYLSLSHVSISYSIDKSFCKKLGLQSAQVTLSGDGLGLWSPKDYPNRNSYKTVMKGDPTQRIISAGLNLSF